MPGEAPRHPRYARRSGLLGSSAAAQIAPCSVSESSPPSSLLVVIAVRFAGQEAASRATSFRTISLAECRSWTVPTPPLSRTRYSRIGRRGFTSRSRSASLRATRSPKTSTTASRSAKGSGAFAPPPAASFPPLEPFPNALSFSLPFLSFLSFPHSPAPFWLPATSATTRSRKTREEGFSSTRPPRSVRLRAAPRVDHENLFCWLVRVPLVTSS